MFIKEIISAESVVIKKYMASLMEKIHKEGPVYLEDMEQLAFIKKFHPDIFIENEKELIFLMGLFYKTSTPESVRQIVYQIFADEIEDNTGHKFTPVQASAYTYIQEKRYFSFSAPTSSGKSFLFRELILETQDDVVIVLPSRALIAEYMYAIKELFKNNTEDEGKSVLILDFIENINKAKTSRRIYIITPERGTQLFKIVDQLNIGMFLFDEAQISEEKSNRGLRFDSFVRRVDRLLPNAKKIFTHPFIDNPEAQLKKHDFNKEAFGEKYSQNSAGKIFIRKGLKKFYYFSPFDKNSFKDPQLNVSDDFIMSSLEKNGTILIYISKAKLYDNRFQSEFSEIIAKCSKIVDPDGLSIIEELKEYIGATDSGKRKSSLIELMKYGIVIHHGSIPLKARFLIEKFINGNHARICFATSTLIQGINMPFNIVWIDNFLFEGDLSDKVLGLKNLIGRSGRTLGNDKNTFDFGYVIVKSSNIETFSKRLVGQSLLKETSILEEVGNEDNEFKELADSIRNDSFNDLYNLPQIQVDRLSSVEVTNHINYILNNLFSEDNTIITGTEYNDLARTIRNRIKDSFKKLYGAHLKRDLEAGENAVISAAIPILLWRIQSKSFKEIISLRYSYIGQSKEISKILKQADSREISNDEARKIVNELPCRLSVVASPLPNKTLSAKSFRFRGQKAVSINYDLLVYDTYDYIDKVISFSLADPLCGALLLHYASTEDIRALTLSNMIRFGTDDDTEIWLMKYGFDSEDIDWIKTFVKDIDENQIIFSSQINDLDEEQLEIIKPYI